MNVLFVDHPEADFLATIAYMGLHALLGPDHLVDYPYKRSFHGETHTYPSIYNRDPNIGWQTWKVGTDGVPMGCTSPFEWMPNLPAREWSETEVVEGLIAKRFDLVVLASPRTYNTFELRRLRAKAPLPPIVLLDGEDHKDLSWNLVDEFRPCVYLKRELLNRPNDRRCRVEPFPFGSPLGPPPALSPEKDIDVFFPCGNTDSSRLRACDALRAAFGGKFVGGPTVRFGHAAYLDAIARAKVAVSVRGYGYDTLRRWEIPSFPTLMLSDRLPLVTPHPFEEDRHCVYFNNPDDLIAKVRRALADNAWRQTVAEAGYAHLRTYHTPRARAQQLLNHAGLT